MAIVVFCILVWFLGFGLWQVVIGLTNNFDLGDDDGFMSAMGIFWPLVGPIGVTAYLGIRFATKAQELGKSYRKKIKNGN